MRVNILFFKFLNILVLIIFLIFKISYFIVDVNKQNFYSILFIKKWEDEGIYMILDIKSLLIRELERFYLSLEDLRKFFYNDLLLKNTLIKLKW